MTLDLICSLLLLFTACTPFWGLYKREWWLGILAVSLVAALVSGNAQRAKTRATELPESKFRPVENCERGFVSSDTCKQCHPSEYATWHASYHRTMTQVATGDSVVGRFDGIQLPFQGKEYRLVERDGKFWVEIQRSDAPERFDPHEIVMTTGSHHMQFYWYEIGKDRALGHLPFVFLFSEDRWVPSDSTFLRPPHDPLSKEPGIWNQNCINCHTTGPQPRFQYSKDTGNLQSVDTKVAEFGIACEACHGPAEQHVAMNGNAFARYEALLSHDHDNRIAHPDTVASKSQSQICGQCHGITFPSDMQSMRQVMWGGFDYRAGKDFLAPDSDRILVQNDPSHPMVAESLRRDERYLRSYFWADGMVRVSGREFNGLVRSPCFDHDDDTNRMQCMSCHQLHPEQALIG